MQRALSRAQVKAVCLMASTHAATTMHARMTTVMQLALRVHAPTTAMANSVAMEAHSTLIVIVNVLTAGSTLATWLLMVLCHQLTPTAPAPVAQYHVVARFVQPPIRPSAPRALPAAKATSRTQMTAKLV
jgi:hypothetical protein